MTTPYLGCLRVVVSGTLALAALLARPNAMFAQSGPRPVEITLGAVLDSVQARAPLMEAARARARAARGERTTAGVFDNPYLMYQVENTPFPGGAPTGMPAERMTTATLPLAPLYQRGARVRQADANVRAADADARMLAQSLTSEATRAYYRVAMAQVAVDAADNVSAWLDSLVAYNRSRVQQGALAEADLIRTELERDRARAEGSMQAAEFARARAALAAFLGEPTTRALSMRVALDELPLRLPAASFARTTDTVASTEIARRPDVMAGQERLIAGDAGASLQQRMLVRDLGAVFGVKATSGVNTMVAGFTMPVPLFDQNRGNRARAHAERDAAAFEVAARQRDARADLLGAEEAARVLTLRATEFAQRDSASAEVAYLQRANSARTIALGAFREGAASLLQVLDAARVWSDARVTYYRTLFAQHEAVIELVLARGDELQSVLPLLTPANPRGSTSR